MKFVVSVPIYASAEIEIEADSPEQAMEKAQEEYSPVLCHTCASAIELNDDPDWDNAKIVDREES